MALLLKTLLNEVKENRINLTRLTVLVEKILPEVDTKDSTRLAELFSEITIMVSGLNCTPYTKFNMEEWRLLTAITQTKLNELKEEAIKLSVSKPTVDVQPLVKALDEIFTY